MRDFQTDKTRGSSGTSPEEMVPSRQSYITVLSFAAAAFIADAVLRPGKRGRYRII